MCFLYLIEHGCVLGIDGGKFKISNKDVEDEYIPRETVEGISIFSKSQVTTQCIEYCLEHNIRISYFSSLGKYYGEIHSHSNDLGQRYQILWKRNILL